MFMIRPFEAADTDAVIAIWRACELTRPWNNPRADIARKLAVQPELFFIGCHAQTPIETPIATAMFGYDGHRGWLYYFAVLPEYQNKGYGRALLAHGEAALTAMGCPKINLQIRDTTTNTTGTTTGTTHTVTAFYEKSGYRADAVLSYGKRLIDDE